MSATRTIGNVAHWKPQDICDICQTGGIECEIVENVDDSGFTLRVNGKSEHISYRDAVRWARDGSIEQLRQRVRALAGVLTAADLDAVRDVPVMPGETPLADMAKPDESMRFTSTSECDACSVPNPVGRACTCGSNPERCVRVPPRVKVRTWTQGNDYAATGGVVFVRSFVDEQSPLAPPVLPRAGRGYSRERVWIAEGHGARAAHPTEAGAVSAWREALANAQREEDACQ